jgi:4-hydroxy-2-oxoheptanedioate aldolase
MSVTGLIQTRKNKVKEKLHAGECVFGAFANGVSTEMVEIMALAGFDFILIDSEHASSSEERNRYLIMAGECHDTTVMVRIPNKISSSALRNLDVGAQGLLVPQVNTKEEAEGIVAASKYYPEGMRGITIQRSGDYGMSEDSGNYFKNANDNTLIAVQCENIACLKNLDAITATPGVDIIFVGPYDLSQSMGIPGQVESEQVQKVVDTVLELTSKYSKYAGIYVANAELAKKYAAMGFKFIIVGSDIAFFSAACTSVVDELKK